MGTNTRPELSKKNTYYISKERFYELKHFCMQYPEWKKAYRELDGILCGKAESDRVNEGEVKDPTYIFVEARLYYLERIEMVENAAKDAVEDLADLLVRSVTEGLSYDYISPPCCKDVWYKGYRRFFWLLDKARK